MARVVVAVSWPLYLVWFCIKFFAVFSAAFVMLGVWLLVFTFDIGYLLVFLIWAACTRGKYTDQWWPRRRMMWFYPVWF